MQGLFIFGLDSMDDNDKIKDDLVKMKASNKIKTDFFQCSYISSCAHDLTHFPS